ncbi:uncharacterized protein [Clytia hemisphaerica]|uniref:uncharacterized protein n=1 Tax=Clytia hemisphaerica TaxID=252671 RepID=UPI0034D40FCA
MMVSIYFHLSSTVLMFAIFCYKDIQCCKNLGIPSNNHGKEPIILVGNEEQELKRNTLVAIIPRLSNEWIVSLDVRLHSPISQVNFQNMWACNIVHFTQGGHSFQYGDRTPFIGIGKTTSKFHITSAVNNVPSFNFNHDGRGQWFNNQPDISS